MYSLACMRITNNDEKTNIYFGFSLTYDLLIFK